MELHYITKGNKEYIAIIDDDEFLSELRDDGFVTREQVELPGEDFTSWPTNRLMMQE